MSISDNPLYSPTLLFWQLPLFSYSSILATPSILLLIYSDLKSDKFINLSCRFMAICEDLGCRINYIAVHRYGGLSFNCA